LSRSAAAGGIHRLRRLNEEPLPKVRGINPKVKPAGCSPALRPKGQGIYPIEIENAAANQMT
jgi:hypothetical protein